MTKINAIGLMSGSSLDGLDICFAEFSLNDKIWTYDIKYSSTYEFSNDLSYKLNQTKNISGLDLMKLDKLFGEFSGKSILDFISKNNLAKSDIDLIASHGHTVFHQPDLHFSTQIGCGATINAITKIKTICDFRSTDTALEGQGAPLVPIGDDLLFNQYDACLNLGGIANISFKESDSRKAYDISFANLPLNYICSHYFNSPYDKDGTLGHIGNVNAKLLTQLEELDFYKKPNPKSLGREDFENDILPLTLSISPENALATYYQHFTDVISKELNAFKNVLITGGGAYNSYFIDLIKSKTSAQLIIPDHKTIEFKEALIFAFLGVLNHNNQINVLKDVTGATSHSISGAVYHAFR